MSVNPAIAKFFEVNPLNEIAGEVVSFPIHNESFFDARKAERSRIPEFTEQQQELFEEFSHLPGSIARRIVRYAVDFEDAVADGNEGLVRGVFGFDPDKVSEDASNSGDYFYQQVYGYIMKGMRTRYGRVHAGGVDKISLVKPGVMYGNSDSIDRTLAGDSNTTYAEIIPLRGAEESITESTELVLADLNLTDRELEIVLKRLDGATQTEISQAIGISQVHVSRILNKIGRRLATNLAESREV